MSATHQKSFIGGQWIESGRDMLSCDWGTTSFRLRRVRGMDGVVVREIREPAGIKSLHDRLMTADRGNSTARGEMFGGFLRAQLEALLAGEVPPCEPLPLVISGMASSTVGWRELPYAPAPFPLDGRGVRAEPLRWNQPDWVGTTLLISGVATVQDMMRGEETEIIGLMSEPGLAVLGERCLLILPGTHSKHVRIENHAMVDWRTFMTGELFDVLGRHSLLRASVESGACSSGPSSEADRAAFCEGVIWAREHGLPGGLFRVRTRAVLDQRPLAENTWFFSGLLLGAELAALPGDAERPPILLAAGQGLAGLYSLALNTVLGPAKWIQVPAAQVEYATIAAHALLLRNR
jgi:2-dehydro-3-deoxygalactonokinase